MVNTEGMDMTKKEAKARRKAYTLALSEGRVVRYNNSSTFKSFNTVADAEAFLSIAKAMDSTATILKVAPEA